jgi:hypothetical protein
MAIQFTDFSSKPLLDSPAKTIFKDVLEGYKMSKEPEKMKQESSAHELANQLKDLEVKHKPKEYALNDQQKSLANSLSSKALKYYDEKYGQEKRLREANIRKANQPLGIKGALANAFQLRSKLDPNDPNYEHDKTAINNYIDKLGRNAGDPSIKAAGEGVKVELPGGEEGYISGTNKLQPGWQEVKNNKGELIGYNVPMTPKGVDQWKAKTKFDVIYPFINKSLSTYSGQHAWDQYTKDLRNYKTDDAAKNRLDNYFAAKKLMSIGSTTENARIGGHATNTQLRELKDTLNSSEVNKRLEKGGSYLLPKGYAKASGDIFSKYLESSEKAAKSNIPSHEYRALNPKNEVLPTESAAPSAKNPPKILGTSKGITKIDYNGKTYQIPENLVDQFMLDHTEPVYGVQYEK